MRDIPHRILLLLASLLCLACGSESSEVPQPQGATAADPTSESAVAARPAPPRDTGAPAAPMPGPGQVFVDYDAASGRVWLRASDALQLKLLEGLSTAAGFELEIGDLRPLRRTVRQEGLPLHESLAGIMGETAYGLDLEFDAERGQQRVARVYVGERQGDASLGAGADPDLSPEARRARLRRWAYSPDRLAARSEKKGKGGWRELQARRAAEAEAGDDDDDVAADEIPEEFDLDLSVEEIEDLDTSGAGLDHAIALANDAPSLDARLAAIQLLGEDGSCRAMNELSYLLESDDSRVLKKTLGACEDGCDDSMRMYVLPLLHHPDSEIRKLAADLLDFLS